MNKQQIEKICKNPELIHQVGMTLNEIAKAVGTTQASVSSTFDSACFKLIKIFKEKGLTKDLEEYLCEYYSKS
jgi:predicted transcriptional regulator